MTLEEVNRFVPGTLMETLGIRFTEITERSLVATMDVTPGHHQPMGILHGGANLALAESVGSAASNVIIDHAVEYCVGLELNANHVRSVKDGKVIATATPQHIGRRTHIWEIRIEDEAGKLVCIARLTNMVLQKDDK